jgi:hypothetical protein
VKRHDSHDSLTHEKKFRTMVVRRRSPLGFLNVFFFVSPLGASAWVPATTGVHRKIGRTVAETRAGAQQLGPRLFALLSPPHQHPLSRLVRAPRGGRASASRLGASADDDAAADAAGDDASATGVTVAAELNPADASAWQWSASDPYTIPDATRTTTTDAGDASDDAAIDAECERCVRVFPRARTFLAAAR